MRKACATSGWRTRPISRPGRSRTTTAMTVCRLPACASRGMGAPWCTHAAARPTRAGAWPIPPTVFGPASSRCGPSTWTQALPACWARWVARKRTVKTSSSRLTDNLRRGRRGSNCGLRRFPGPRPPTSSPTFAVTIRIQNGLPMAARLRWSALAAITASSRFMISDGNRCAIFLPARTAIACRAGRRMAGTLLSSASRAFKRRFR